MDSGNDYVIQVKANRKKLYQSVVSHTTKHIFREEVHTQEVKRGRTENRTYTTSRVPENEYLKQWEGLRQIIRVKHSGTRENKPYHKIHYYITSLENYPIKKIAEGIRNHWRIENNLHWVKDAIMYEDKSRIKGFLLASNMSMIRTIVLNIYNLKQVKSIKCQIEKVTNNLDQCSKILLSISKLNI